MSGNLMVLLPLLGFMAGMLALGFYVRRQSAAGGFLSTYFVGGQSLGGFVLAMTMVATYSSVSSFVGGPGMAYEIGFGWIYMAVIQTMTIFLVLGIFGTRVARLARRIHAVTIVDIIRHRYRSDALAAVAAFVIVLFFAASMVAQFVGGAQLFAAVTGYSYELGLVLFGIVVVIYTSIGGFRAVALTDTCCAIVMMLGIVLLFYYVLAAGGGFTAILEHLRTAHPAMLTPTAEGRMPISLYVSQWLLVGALTIALPQSVVRGISYRSSRDMHRAMIIGTVVIAFMNIAVNLVGVLGRGVLGVEAKELGDHRAARRLHLDHLGRTHRCILRRGEGRLPPPRTKARQGRSRGASAPSLHGGHCRARRDRLSPGGVAAVAHLAHQYVRVRWPRDGVLLGARLRPLYALGQPHGRTRRDGGRHGHLLRGNGTRDQTARPASDLCRHHRLPHPIPRGELCGAAQRAHLTGFCG